VQLCLTFAAFGPINAWADNDMTTILNLCPNLTSLSLSGFREVTGSCFECAPLGLVYLNVNLDKAVGMYPILLQRSPKLKRLKLEGMWSSLVDSLCAVSRYNKQLEEVNVNGGDAYDEESELYKESLCSVLKQAPLLKKLSLKGTFSLPGTIPKVSIQELSLKPRNRLLLTYDHPPDYSNLYQFLYLFTSLTTLTVSFSLTQDALRKIVSRNPLLHTLCFPRKVMSPNIIQVLIDTKRKLQTLWITDKDKWVNKSDVVSAEWKSRILQYYNFSPRTRLIPSLNFPSAAKV
jgi:hypothetical protein